MVNALLEAMPREIRARWYPHQHEVLLERHDILLLPDGPVTDLYFPTTARVTVLHDLRCGRQAEVARIGAEGCVGLFATVSGVTCESARVQLSGRAIKIDRAFLKRELLTSHHVLDMVMRSGQMLVEQIAQMAICNLHHHLPEQTCRWLLDFTDDRHWIDVTQQEIATSLGVQRPAINRVLADLVTDHVIEIRHGGLRIRHRQLLVERACECYHVIQKTRERLLAS